MLWRSRSNLAREAPHRAGGWSSRGCHDSRDAPAQYGVIPFLFAVRALWTPRRSTGSPPAPSGLPIPSGEFPSRGANVTAWRQCNRRPAGTNGDRDSSARHDLRASDAAHARRIPMERVTKGWLIASAAAALILSGTVPVRAADKAGGGVVEGAGVHACKRHGAGHSGDPARKRQNAGKGKGS